MPTESILIAEPDQAERKALADKLYERNYDVDEVATATAAVFRLRENAPDLIVLDSALPDLNGIEFLREFASNRQLRNTRVLMTSDRESADATAAFDAGADDFMSKPYVLDELCSRISVCLRKPPIAYIQSTSLAAGVINMNDVSHRVSIDNHFLELWPREYQLLNFFLNNPDRLFSRQHLLAGVWKHHDLIGERTVDVHIRRLRSRLAKYNCDHYIQTIRGEGYRFSVPQNSGHTPTVDEKRVTQM